MKSRILTLVAVMVVLFSVLSNTMPMVAPAQAQTGNPNLEIVGQIGGSTNAFFVQGNYAYINEGQRLVILDINNPANPTVVGRSAVIPDVIILKIVVNGNYAYVLNTSSKLLIFNVSNPTSPTLAGSYDLQYRPTNNHNIYVNGNYLYVPDYFRGLQIINVSNPASPTLAGTYSPEGGTIHSSHINGNYAYFVTQGNGEKLEIVDLSNPATPIVVGSLIAAPQTRYGLVYVNGTHAYISNATFSGENPQLQIIDISNPATPTLLGSYQTSVYIQDVYVNGGYAYINTYNTQISKSELQIVDVSNPTTPTFAGSSEFVGTLQASGNYLYLGDGIGLNILNISNPAQLSLTGSYQNPLKVHRVKVSGNYAYVGDFGKLKTLNITNPATPIIMGSYDTLSTYGIGSIEVKGSYACVTTYDKGLQIINISNPATPVLAGSYTPPSGNISVSYVSGNYAYISTNNTITNIPQLEIINISNPTAPVLVGSYNTKSQPRDIHVSGGYAYLVEGRNGLEIVNVSNPVTPIFVGSYNRDQNGGLSGTWHANRVYVSGSYAYIGYNQFGESGLDSSFDIININNPTTPIFVGSDNRSFREISDVEVHAPYLYLGDQDSLTIFDVNTPTQPILTGTYTLPSIAYDVEVSGNYVYVADGSGGLSILRFNVPVPNAKTFQVARDGVGFNNFDYPKTNLADNVKWQQFKKTFPATQMELADGQRRKGPLTYYNSDLYQTVGVGGNCAGFTGASLVRFMGLPETVELSLLSSANQLITNVNKLPESNDVKDYIHLYQARQLNQQSLLWWNGTLVLENGQWLRKNRHFDDKPLQTYQAIKTATQKNEALAVDIYENGAGHRMVAYRTEETNGLGYIYVYDSNWPNDSTRRIQVNLTTGQWQYELWAGLTWSNSNTNLFYTPVSLNSQAELMASYNKDSARRQASNQPTETILTVNGAANLLVKNAQGHELGYKNGVLVKGITGGMVLYAAGYNPDKPTASNVIGFVVPTDSNYNVAIQPLTNSGNYTLTAFTDGSAMQLNNINIATNTVDTLMLNGSVLSTTFKAATDANYCHSVTHEEADSSRDLTSCVTGATNSAVSFGLNATGEQLAISNGGNQPINVTTTIDQVGAGAVNQTTTETIAQGDSAVVTVTTGSHTYLPLIVK